MNENQSNPKCRVCRSDKTTYLCETHNEHSKTTTLAHYKCVECGSVFVGNEIDSDELTVAYSGIDWKAYYDEIDAENKDKMHHAINSLQYLTDKSASIIDIGAGNGMFAKMLIEAGFSDVSAHEIAGADLSLVEGIASQIYLDFDYSTIEADAFDLVSLLDVVEHVLDPGYLFSTCGRILRNNGMVYFHTPVVTRTDRLFHFVCKLPLVGRIASVWQRGRTSIYHLENYTPKALRKILGDAGFKDIQIEVRNELSWPLSMYIRTYFLDRVGLPAFLAPVLVPVFYPLLATNLLNANKSIVSARKA